MRSERAYAAAQVAETHLPIQNRIRFAIEVTGAVCTHRPDHKPLFVRLSEYVRRHADIMTMAVGLTINGDQAEQILRD